MQRIPLLWRRCWWARLKHPKLLTKPNGGSIETIVQPYFSSIGVVMDEPASRSDIGSSWCVGSYLYNY
jgi:hypothetical protein